MDTHLKLQFDSTLALESFNFTSKVEAFLTDLTEAIGMRTLFGPVSVDVPIEISKLGSTPYEDEGGVTGIVVLSTSHCAIHTWPLQNKAVLDVYSCRSFDLETVEKEIQKAYEPTYIIHTWVTLDVRV
jgi:S-adenosylmethionine/arginine decarboxylase-like enzyme